MSKAPCRRILNVPSPIFQEKTPLDSWDLVQEYSGTSGLRLAPELLLRRWLSRVVVLEIELLFGPSYRLLIAPLRENRYKTIPTESENAD